MNDLDPIAPSAITTAPTASVVVVSIDRLSAGALGPFGNTSIETTALNRWAAESVLFDAAIANSPDLLAAYDAYWTVPPIPNDESKPIADVPQESLPAALAQSGWSSTLVTDEPALIDPAQRHGFDEVLTIEPTGGQTASSAATAADTQLANFFAHASQAFSRVRPGSLLWLHSQGMNGPWDAPAEYRQSLAAPDDPPPPTFVRPPTELIDLETVDPDLLLGFEQAYAAQVLLLDQLLEVLSEQLNTDARFAETWLVFTSPRGYPLGQHGVVGDAIDPDRAGARLHQEALHVPLMICPPPRLANRYTASRCGQLVQNDWLAKFLQQLSVGQGVELLQRRLDRMDDETAVTVSTVAGATAVQTPAWKLISSDIDRLYAKPDDRWEVNNVSDRCSVELAEMKALLK